MNLSEIVEQKARERKQKKIVVSYGGLDDAMEQARTAESNREPKWCAENMIFIQRRFAITCANGYRPRKEHGLNIHFFSSASMLCCFREL